MSGAAPYLAIAGVLLTAAPVLWAGGSLAGILTQITKTGKGAGLKLRMRSAHMRALKMRNRTPYAAVLFCLGAALLVASELAAAGWL